MIQKILFDFEDYIFDLIHGIKTRERVLHDDLRTDSAHKVHATAYQTVWCRNLRALIREAKRHGFRGAFLDIGCGKGKACFYAACHGFKEILGIDFDKSLLATAEENLKHFGESAHIRFQHADAAVFIAPPEPTLVFMFNPFNAILLDRFMSNNSDNIRKSRSMIAYANDREKEVLVAHGMTCLFREPERKVSLWQFPI